MPGTINLPSGPVGAGFGSVVNPGGVSSFGSVVSPIYSVNQSFATRLGGAVSGNPSGLVGPVRVQRPAAIYPVFIGGGYGYNYSQQPNVTVINEVRPSPTVIVNQNFIPDSPARPVVREYGSDTDRPAVNTLQIPSPSYPEGQPLAQAQNRAASFSPAANVEVASAERADDKPTVYLIALQDGAVYAAYAYWTEGSTLHYITPGHAHNQVSLDRVDPAMSRRLNDERKVEFHLK
jgi:hypothetical protein